VIAYSAVFGGYDRPRRAPPGGVLFTDRAPSRRLGWDARVVTAPYPDNLARSNRFYKLQPHAHLDADRVLYLDASMTLTASPAEVLRAFQAEAGGDHDVFTLRHSLGHTVADEPAWVEQKGITRASVLARQVARYHGVPAGTPTAEARLIIARLPEAIAFLDAWWAEVREFSHRDQVSFPFAWWSTRADVFLVPFRFARSFFTIARHARPQLRDSE
jgi:hypothetical protein